MRNHSGILSHGVMTRALAVLLSGSLALPAVAADPPGERQVEVIVAAANVRSAGSTTSAVVFRLERGAIAKVIGTEGAWYLVEDATGRRGYVSSTLVRVRPEPTTAKVETTAAPSAPGQTALEIDHKPVGCIVAEQYPKLDACLEPESNVGRAYVHFRALENGPWYSVELKRDGDCYSTLLPKPKRTTHEIQYFVDVIDRGMTERQRPDDAPDGAYRARVVAREGDCNLGKVALRLARSAAPIVVGVARDAGGAILDVAAAHAAEGAALLAGFSTDGVVMAATGAAPAAASAASSSSGAASGGGISGTTIAIVGGVVAAGAIALAAKGGGGGSGGGGGGGATPPATQPSAPGVQPGTGDIAFRLQWTTGADLDLYVQEPNGNVLYFANPASPSGGRLDVDSNAACSNLRTNPVENVFWPTGTAPRGTYVYWVQHFGCGPASPFTLQVLRGVGGAVAATQSGNLNPGGQSQRFSYQF